MNTDFDLDVEIAAVPTAEAGIKINLPHDLVTRLTEMAIDYSICVVCSWEVSADEQCHCGILGGISDEKLRAAVEAIAGKLAETE